ncbi:hypothetical protein D8674_003878 [Pyrus ussuriensis x Pyrus communis]|uniref:Uncharacterized protein n=1 Tax=Pyrus ussuriensis x Pyrus communis TaxID=2448454 RepID=A0A5N5FIY4_9ROSA|nr:hypothetical protein D8674_003878 [Pyrus ussuriensis x Pyrus communis]
MYAEEISVNSNVNPTGKYNMPLDVSVIPKMGNPPPQVTANPRASNSLQRATGTPGDGEDLGNRPPPSINQI